MEHYDWNDGWLFAPVFTPALVQPDRAEELTPVRVPHTVKPLPYNYCNENDYQRLSGYRDHRLRNLVLCKCCQSRSLSTGHDDCLHHNISSHGAEICSPHYCLICFIYLFSLSFLH